MGVRFVRRMTAARFLERGLGKLFKKDGKLGLKKR
jgi:hypothetical protein